MKGSKSTAVQISHSGNGSVASSKVFYAYTRENDQFLVAQTDNRASLWNCLNGNEEKVILQKEFLSSQIEAIDVTKKKGTETIVVANSKGQILTYDVRTQKQSILERSHTGSVFDVKFNEDATHFYTIAADKKLFKFDLQLGKVIYTYELKRKNLLESGCLAVLRDQQILLACENKITLLDTLTNTEVMKFKGHSKSVRLIRVGLGCSTHFASFSDEGFINIYAIRENAPVHSVSVLSKSALVNLIFAAHPTTKNTFILIAVHSDSVETWEISLAVEGQSQQFSVCKANKQVNLLDTSNILYAAASLNANSKSLNLSIAFGNNASVQFASIRALVNGSFDFDEVEQKLVLIGKKKAVKKSGQDIIERAQEKNAFIPSEKDQVEIVKLNATEGAEVTGEVEKQNTQLLEEINNVKKLTKEDITSAQSLTVVLQQALHNNDTQLIDFCLEKDNEEMIDSTIRGLASTRVLILLDKLYDRLNSTPFKGRTLGRWLRAILKYHSTILIASPSAQLKLHPLMVLIDNRTKNLEKLIGLRGKIDMVLALRKAGNTLPQATHLLSSEEAKRTPLVVFQEGESKILEEVTAGAAATKSKKRGARKEVEDFSDSVSEDEDSDDGADKMPADDEDNMSDLSSDVDGDFDKAASQKFQDKLSKYKDANFEDEEDEDDDEMQQEDSSYMEV